MYEYIHDCKNEMNLVSQIQIEILFFFYFFSLVSSFRLFLIKIFFIDVSLISCNHCTVIGISISLNLFVTGLLILLLILCYLISRKFIQPLFSCYFKLRNH